MTGNPQGDNIFADISNSYYQFTSAEKKVADYVLVQKTNVQYMSISELAEECGVAEATVSRFCRRLKQKGYNAFKLAVAKATPEAREGLPPARADRVGEAASTDSVSELCRRLYTVQMEAVAQSMALLRPEQVLRAVDLLRKADKVYCMGQGGSMLLAQEAAHLFSTVCPRFFAVQDSHLQASAAATLAPGDTLLFFSYSGSTKEIVELMGLARARGGRIILITRFAKSPGAAQADVVLQCGSNEGPLQLGSIPARMAQLFVVDVLYHEFVRRDPDTARSYQEHIADALAEKHL